MSVKELLNVSMFAVILFTQQLALASIPNVQLTFLLLIVYSKTIGTKKTLIIIFVHVVLNMLVYGAFNPWFNLSMFVGFAFIPILLNTVFDKAQNYDKLALLSVLFSLLYSWAYIPVTVFIFEIPFIGYLMADIPFEIILSFSSYMSVLFLYDPLKRIFVIKNIKNNLIDN